MCRNFYVSKLDCRQTKKVENHCSIVQVEYSTHVCIILALMIDIINSIRHNKVRSLYSLQFKLKFIGRN